MKGDVAVLDETSQYMESVVTGMVLKSGRIYLTAYDGKSKAVIISGGLASVISPGEWYLVLRQGKVRKGKHRERKPAGLFMGRLWAKIARENKDLNLKANVAVGVRGRFSVARYPVTLQTVLLVN